MDKLRLKLGIMMGVITRKAVALSESMAPTWSVLNGGGERNSEGSLSLGYFVSPARSLL